MKFLAKLLLTGALAVLPLLATAYVGYWLYALIEDSFGLPVRWAIGGERYAEGMGFALALAVFLVFGILMRTPPLRRLYRRVEGMVMAIPIVKTVYGALRDFFDLFARRKGDEALQVVAIDLPGADMRVLGFITRTDFAELPDGVAGDDEIAVYLPMSYQIVGYTVFLPRSRVREIATSREDAMRFVLMAGVKAQTAEGDARKRRD